LSDLIIKIGDDELDLAADQTIAITKQAAKVGDFSTILLDGTNEVTIPLTPNNKTILDNANLVESDSNKPYGRLEATLIQEGYETIQDGYAIVKSSKNDFSLQVVGGNASFFDLIKDLELRDLPLSEFDHFWTNTNVYNLRNETEGLIYAVFEQSSDAFTMRTYSSTPNSRFAVHTDELLPSFYIKTLVEKIFEQQGYTFVTDLVSEDIYDKAVVFRAETPNRGEDMSHHNCTVVSDSFDSPNTNLFQSAIVTNASGNYTSSSEFQSLLETPTKRFTLTDSCRVTVDFSMNLFYTQTFPYTTNMRMRVFATSESGLSTYDSEVISVDIGVVGDPNDIYNFTMTFDVSEFNGDIYFQVQPFFDFDFGFLIDDGSSYTVRDTTLIANSEVSINFPNNYITGAVPVPEMKQGEFLKELARMYQWVYDTDERTRTVTARRYDEIKENTVDALDLSDKLHVEDININYGLKGFAQTNALKYKEDDETKYDAVGYINVADTTLKAEKDYVKMSNLAASSTRKRFVNVDAPYVPIFEGQEPVNGLTDRVLLVRRENPFDENVNFNRLGDDYGTSDLTFAYFAEAGNNDSLDFPTLIDRFYQTVIDMNDKGKTIECLMNLDIKDVQNYDPFKPVYISHFGNYFYWEKLSNYVKDNLTKCTFVRI